jgi:tetratricopeptide (TPR) repeat protein
MPRIKLSKPAEKDLEQSLREGLPLTFARLADLYRQRGLFQEAEDIYRDGLKVFPDYGTGHIVLAGIQMDKGEVEKALMQYHLALKCEPDNLYALKMIADIHWQTEAHSLAKSYYKQVLRRDSNCRTALERVKGKPLVDTAGLAMETDVTTEGSNRPTTESERNVFGTVTLARLYMSQGHVDLAREICRSIVESDPSDQNARDMLDEINTTAKGNK